MGCWCRRRIEVRAPSHAGARLSLGFKLHIRDIGWTRAVLPRRQLEVQDSATFRPSSGRLSPQDPTPDVLQAASLAFPYPADPPLQPACHAGPTLGGAPLLWPNWLSFSGSRDIDLAGIAGVGRPSGHGCHRVTGSPPEPGDMVQGVAAIDLVWLSPGGDVSPVTLGPGIGRSNARARDRWGRGLSGNTRAPSLRAARGSVA